MSAPNKPKADWEQIEKLYRAGNLSLAEIGARCGVTKQAIDRKAKRLGWTRDLTYAVRKATQEKLARQAVDDAVDGKHGRQHAKATETEIVEANSSLGAAVVTHHRRDIRAGRELTALLLGQLLQASEHVQQIEQQIEAETKDDDTAHRRVMMYRAVSLPSRAGVLRDLTTSMKNLQGLERTAFGLKDDDGAGDDDKPANMNLAVTFVKPNG